MKRRWWWYRKYLKNKFMTYLNDVDLLHLHIQTSWIIPPIPVWCLASCQTAVLRGLAPDFLATLATLARLSGHFTISNAASNTHNWFPSVCFCHENDHWHYCSSNWHRYINIKSKLDQAFKACIHSPKVVFHFLIKESWLSLSVEL